MKRSHVYCFQNQSTRGGFTLVELVVVMLILTILSAIAVQSLDSVQDQGRFDATQRQITNIEAAIGSSAASAIGTSVSPVSFIADFGRLPRQRSGGAEVQLRELWQQSDSTVPYALPSYATYTGPVISGTYSFDDSDLKISAGWRGPYLRMPPRVSSNPVSLYDGWGNPFEIGYMLGSSLPEPTGAQISLRSLGSNNNSNDSTGDEYRFNVPENPLMFDSEATVRGIVYEYDSSSHSKIPLQGAIVYFLCPVLNSAETGFVITRIPDAPKPQIISDVDGKFEISNVPIGQRVLRARHPNPLVTQPATVTVEVPKGGIQFIKVILRAAP